MLRRSCALTAIAAILAAALTLTAAPAQPPRERSRVIFISIDAGADWIFDELLKRGKAPAFARMADQGAHADALITVMPTLTAVSHASLWTGAWPDVHGITGNNVPVLPRSQHRVTQSRSGYENGGLTAEPIWIAAARQGRRVMVGQATGAAPFPTSWSDRLLMFDTYAAPLLPLEVIEGRVATNRPFLKTIGDAELAIATGPPGQLDVTLGSFRSAMTPGVAGRFSPPIPITVAGKPGYTRLRLIAYSPERRTFRLLRGRIDELTSNRPGRAADLRAAAGTLVGENVSRPYARGRFGPTRAEGGDGTAEEILAQIVEANHEYFAGIAALAARETWDLLVTYVSTLDIVAHAFGALIDPDTPDYQPEVAASIWPVIERIVARTLDPFIAGLRARHPDATLVVAADHGIEGATRYVYPNVTLRKAGLLRLTPDGSIDVSRTKVLQMASTAGSLFLNTTDWKDGIVPPGERTAVKRQAIAALLAIRDSAGTAPIRAFFDVDLDGAGLGVGGPASPDLYFDTSPGYTSSARATGDAEVEAMEAAGAGEHGNPPWRRTLHAIFFAAGPHVARRTRPGLVRTIDVAPTVARLLGIEPPAQSAGHVITLGPGTR